MPTVIVNDLTIEPKTLAPASEAASPRKSAVPAGPELEHEVEKLECRMHERQLRNWAH